MIDVIIPTYNRAKALALVIDSYLIQEHLGSIIIVDDCSIDTTEHYVQSLVSQYPDKIIYHRLDRQESLPFVRNVGIQLATQDLIFMGEDDVFLPKDHFKILLEKMNEYHADIISGRRINKYADQSLDGAKIYADKDKGPLFTKIPFEAYLERNVVQPISTYTLHSNVLMKKTVASSIMYDPLYTGNAFREETDFFLRVWDAGYSLWLIPDTLSYHMKNDPVNTTGGSRKKRLVYEWQAFKNTWRLFIKNKAIFKKLFGIKNIYGYFIMCSIARYTYGLQRRYEQWTHKNA